MHPVEFIIFVILMFGTYTFLKLDHDQEFNRCMHKINVYNITTDKNIAMDVCNPGDDLVRNFGE